MPPSRFPDGGGLATPVRLGFAHFNCSFVLTATCPAGPPATCLLSTCGMPSRTGRFSPPLSTEAITSFRAPAHLLPLLAEEKSSYSNSQDHYELPRPCAPPFTCLRRKSPPTQYRDHYELPRPCAPPFTCLWRIPLLLEKPRPLQICSCSQIDHRSTTFVRFRAAPYHLLPGANRPLLKPCSITHRFFLLLSSRDRYI